MITSVTIFAEIVNLRNVLMTFSQALVFFFALLNPFLLSLYLMAIITRFEFKVFIGILTRGVIIAGMIFSMFALTGDAIFSKMLHVDFSSFQIFGGILFLIVGIRFFFEGPEAIGVLRGEPEHLAGSIAMPFLVGPATVSAAVMMGSQLSPTLALSAIWITMLSVIVGLALLKFSHDHLRERNNKLVERYVDITGRVSALMIGTFAVQMIVTGLHTQWPNGV